MDEKFLSAAGPLCGAAYDETIYSTPQWNHSYKIVLATNARDEAQWLTRFLDHRHVAVVLAPRPLIENRGEHAHQVAALPDPHQQTAEHLVVHRPQPPAMRPFEVPRLYD